MATIDPAPTPEQKEDFIELCEKLLGIEITEPDTDDDTDFWRLEVLTKLAAADLVPTLIGMPEQLQLQQALFMTSQGPPFASS